VRVVETTLSQRPPAPAQPQPPQRQEGSAPPPSRGLSIRGAPTGGGGGGAPAQPPPEAPQQGQAQPAAPEKSDKPEGSGDDASTRFGLLELD
jgi:hypothetical protein